MIPEAYITAWRTSAPWVEDAQVEQDLVISRALVEIFSDEYLREALAFRGGTALYKLHLSPARYSEDIDLVQVRQETIGETADRHEGGARSLVGFSKLRQQIRSIRTFGLHELLATKLRALYQRKKGRDLYDLWKAGQDTELDYDLIVDHFHEYMTRGETPITQLEFARNLDEKGRDRSFTADIGPLLAETEDFNFDIGLEFVLDNYISRV